MNMKHLTKEILRSTGNNMRILRRSKGWTQSYIASCLRLTTPAYSKIERGNTDVSLSRLEQIASLFDTSVGGLLYYHDKQDVTYTPNSMGLQVELIERDKEIKKLQGKLIALHEEITGVNRINYLAG
jgi:transcriptional regulator with XRE-family HTH domain